MSDPAPAGEIRCWNMVPNRTAEDQDSREATRFGFSVGREVWTGTVSYADLWAALAGAGLISRDAEMEASARRAEEARTSVPAWLR
jgi:hypothetical protein